MLLEFQWWSPFLSSNKTNRFDSNKRKVASQTNLVQHGNILVHGATVGTFNRGLASIHGIKGETIDLELLGIIIVQCQLIAGHLFALLQHLGSLGTQISIAFTTHVGKFQEASSKTCG
jgi:hypothetical protein